MLSISEAIIAAILSFVLLIWLICGLLWSINCWHDSNNFGDDIKKMIHDYFFIEKYKSGNWFGKILISLLIMILLPHIVSGIVLYLVIFICSEIYILIQKIGGWDE